MKVASLILLCGAIALTGCGGSADATSDPRDVARMYVAATYECGELGAGVRYDLSTSPDRDWDRETYLRLERQGGCRERLMPGLRTALLTRESDVARVRVDGDGRPVALLLLVRLNGQWKVDTSRSTTP